jgi:hypothetical protein
MKRISDENGFYAGQRNFGRLALALIPAALGGASILWIIASFGWIDLTSSLQIQSRRMDAVGLKSAPKEPIRLIFRNSSCLKIESGSLEGRTLTIYVKNECSTRLDLPNYIYLVKANETTIESEQYAFDGNKRIAPKERREQVIKRLNFDERATSIEIEVRD